MSGTGLYTTSHLPRPCECSEVVFSAVLFQTFCRACELEMTYVIVGHFNLSRYLLAFSRKQRAVGHRGMLDHRL